MKYVSIVAAFALMGSAAIAAPVGSILGQGSDGNVYQISTFDASVTLYQDLDPIAGIAPNSPNGLGYNLFNKNTAFRTDYNAGNVQNYLYRNNDQLVEIPGASQSVASGDVQKDVFYYLDRSGTFYSVDNIFGAAGAQTVTNLGAVPSADQTYGDIAIRGDSAFISTGNTFASFSLANPTAGFTASTTPTMLFAGLAFDGSSLYGFTAKGSDLTNQLYSISLAAGSFGTASFIGEIVLAGVLLTDAAPTPVPLPAAAWLLIAGMAGLGFLGRRRAEV